MALNKSIPFPHKKYGMYYVEEDLRDAAYRGDTKRIKDLMEKYPNLNLNATNEYGETAVYIACKRNQNDTVDFLLKQRNIDIKIPTILGNNSILIAAWNDNTDLVKKLVTAGIDVTSRTNPDRKYHGNVSALDIAEERENTALIEFLKPLIKSKVELNLPYNSPAAPAA